jgi:hypothetical protein
LRFKDFFEVDLDNPVDNLDWVGSWSPLFLLNLAINLCLAFCSSLGGRPVDCESPMFFSLERSWFAPAPSPFVISKFFSSIDRGAVVLGEMVSATLGKVCCVGKGGSEA